MRHLGMLAAIGATYKQLRLVTLTNGTIVGAVAAVIGATVGFADGPSRPRSSRMRRLPHRPFDVPWWLIASGCCSRSSLARWPRWWPAGASPASRPYAPSPAGHPSRGRRAQRPSWPQYPRLPASPVSHRRATWPTRPRSTGRTPCCSSPARSRWRSGCCSSARWRYGCSPRASDGSPWPCAWQSATSRATRPARAPRSPRSASPSRSRSPSSPPPRRAGHPNRRQHSVTRC